MPRETPADGAEGYDPILRLFNEVAEEKPAVITMNLHGLQFLNSSGINTLSKFILRVRSHNMSHMVIRGTSEFPWQAKSLPGLKRLMPELEVLIE